MTLSDALMRHFKDELGFEIPGLFHPQMRLLIHEETVQSGVDQPKWSDERRLMRRYWDRVASQDNERGSLSFFGLERLPDWQNDFTSLRKVFENRGDAAKIDSLSFWDLRSPGPMWSLQKSG